MEKNSIPRFPNPFPDPFTISGVAVVLDNYAKGRGTNISSIQELIKVFKKYQPSENSKIGPNLYIQFYDPLVRAMRKCFKKDIRDTSELALEMRLLISELETIKTKPNQERINKKIIPFLCTYSQELMTSNYPLLI